jgi:hypothetical protein
MYDRAAAQYVSESHRSTRSWCPMLITQLLDPVPQARPEMKRDDAQKPGFGLQFHL